MKIFFSAFFLFFLSTAAFPQEADIIPYLKKIEAGESFEVKAKIPQLKKDYPNSSSVLFLEGVVTENGQEAVSIFKKLMEKYPASSYADAAVYRIYSYYFALGFYDEAKRYLERLKKFYPDSPYIKIAERDIPSKNEEVALEKPAEENPDKPAEKFEPNLPKIYKYSIQAGAFGDEKNALALKKDFDLSGFHTSIKNKTVGGTEFKIVVVGRFETEDEARSFLQVINSEFKIDGRIIPFED